MRQFNLTTRLNIKAICIISIFMIFFTMHNQWISYQARIAVLSRNMDRFTAYLQTVIPPEFLIINEESVAGPISLEEQVLAINNKVQPILNNIFMPSSVVKYGVYSSKHKRIVAIGPELEKPMLSVETTWCDIGDASCSGEKSNSVVWYGAQIMYFVKPLTFNNEVVGYTFACINLDRVRQEIFWANTQKLLLGGIIALLIAIMLFQEIFIRLKKDLALFAEATVAGQSKGFESKIPELTPVLQYLSEQTDRMARLDRLNIIGEMAASIGHEVRNPMTTVRGFLQYMGSKPNFSEYKSQLDLMISEIDRANSIITEFLSLAKNKAMHFKDSDLNAMICEVIPLLDADALRYNCHIKLDLNEIPPVCVDHNSMRQLILNLVRNGIEAMPDGGEITISTAYKHGKVLLSVADQGVGISSEDKEKLGTPFFTTKENGVGLGLAVCYRIVQRHNATITVESEPGKGTSFLIKFAAASMPQTN